MSGLPSARPAGSWGATGDGRRGVLARVETVLLFALLLRVAWALAVPIVPVSDGVLYDGFARSIASGRGYAYPNGGPLTAYWPVGAPALYAALYRVFDVSHAAVAAFNVGLGVAIVALARAIALRHFGARVALVTAWLLALWPLLIQFTTVFASELPFMALVLAAVWVWGTERGPLAARAALWGALVAAATYVRPTAWPMLVLLPALGFLARHDLRRALVEALVAVLVAAALFAPWVQRNQALFGRFVLVATNGGPNLWMGNNPHSNGGYMELPATAFANEAERDRRLGAEAVAFIRERPLDYLRLCVQRIGITYSRESIGVVWNERGLAERYGTAVLLPLKALSALYWWAVLALGAAGALRAWRRGTIGWVHPIWVLSLFFFAIPVLTVGQDRYHVPLAPFLAMFAACAVSGRPPRGGPPGAGATRD